MSIETDDRFTPIYLEFHTGFDKLIEKGVTLIQITGEPNSNIIFNKDDIKYIKLKGVKRRKDPLNKTYTDNIKFIKNNLYLDLMQLDNLNNINFFLFVPYLNKKKQFYYSIIVGLINPNYSLLNKINFNLIKNISFLTLQSSNFNYDFFRNFLNFDKNIFKEIYNSKEASKLIYYYNSDKKLIIN